MHPQGSAACGQDFSFADAGDGPAIFVMLFAGFVVVGAALVVEILYQPPYWLHAALWVPLLWFAIIGTRPVSFWFNPGQRPDSVEKYLEGSPLDAAGYMILLALGIAILLRRRIDWGQVIKSNKVLVAFFAYCLISLAWSDFLFVGLKRYIKDCGNVVMVMVSLGEGVQLAETAFELQDPPAPVQ